MHSWNEVCWLQDSKNLKKKFPVELGYIWCFKVTGLDLLVKHVIATVLKNGHANMESIEI